MSSTPAAHRVLPHLARPHSTTPSARGNPWGHRGHRPPLSIGQMEGHPHNKPRQNWSRHPRSPHLGRALPAGTCQRARSCLSGELEAAQALSASRAGHGHGLSTCGEPNPQGRQTFCDSTFQHERPPPPQQHCSSEQQHPAPEVLGMGGHLCHPPH